MAQRPCPNCHGYKLIARQAVVDKKTGKANVLKGSTGLLIAVLLFGIFITITSASGETKGIPGIILGVLLIVFCVLAFIFPKKADGYMYECEICGKVFYVGNDQSWPATEDHSMSGANAIKAALHYGEEQARKQKEQDELAEAAHFLEQHRHK